MLNYWQESVKMVLPTLFFHTTGLTPSQILSALIAEDIVTTRQTIARFIKRFSATGTKSRKEGSGTPSNTLQLEQKIFFQKRELISGNTY